VKETVAIIGMGMMGASLGKTIKSRGIPYRVLGLGRNSKHLNQAMVLGACDAVTVDLNAGVQEADIVVICTPVDTIPNMVEQILPTLKKTAIVTDIGSVKSTIVEAINNLSSEKMDFCFIGAHPLCGSEKTGAENFQEDLYKGSTVVLTPLESNSKEAVGKLKNFWQKVGCKVLVMEPEVHDILVAQTSHLPHVLAGCLVKLIARLQKQDERVKDILAGSFKDMTRICASDPNQWREIVQGNEKFVMGALKSYRDLLTHLISEVEKGIDTSKVWNSHFVEAQQARAELLPKN